MSNRKFGVVRPYEDWLRESVFEFLASLDYVPGDDLVVPPGTPDEDAAAWIHRQDLDLLLLPYNKHRSSKGAFVDGIGVSLLISEAWTQKSPRTPILMPVTNFSMGASFERRYRLLKKEAPHVAARLVVMPESRIGSDTVAARVRDIASGRLGAHSLDTGS